jgi:hypothetical protein
LFKSADQKQESLVATMFVNGSGRKLAELWWEAEPLFSVSKAQTFVVLQLVTNVALIEYT